MCLILDERRINSVIETKMLEEEEEEQQQDQSVVNFIPCLCFVKRGVAKENPDKVTLTREELAKVISETKRELDDEDEENNDGDETMEMSETEENQPQQNARNRARPSVNSNPNDEFNFDAYDDEDGNQVAAIGDIAVIDPNENLSDGEDSEAEDDLIKTSDNLILVGHVDDDAASLEVYVYNEEEGSMYVHHDFLLPSFPLCIEWMNYDPESKDPGNMCAIGCMDPIITIWDLDIQDTLEPALKLGSKGKRKKNLPKFGHTDAVLDLSWNTNFSHILASASVDQTVILWDLDEGKPHTTIKAFDEKVQTLKFHPTEAQMLLTGSCDGCVKLFDCRDPDAIDTSFKRWTFANSEIERVLWDPNDTNYYFAATNHGKIIYCDIRQEGETVWTVQAHNDEVSGILVNHMHAGMLSTTSADGTLKVWRYDANGATLVHEDELGVGRVQCSDSCIDNGFTLAVGGDNRQKQLRLIDVRDYDSVKNAFRLLTT